MSSVSLARNFARTPRHIVRHVSNKPSTSPPSFSLPPQKLRALISLYHESEGFITPENLDARIDLAFTDFESSSSVHKTHAGQLEMRSALSDRRRLPRYGAPEDSARLLSGSVLDDRKARVDGVFDALYGTWNAKRPGLELLQDTWGQVEQQLKDAKQEDLEERALRNGQGEPGERPEAAGRGEERREPGP
ncbi:hypothetical protein BV25DRAFT_1817986 [Artomyces pyxidatus]|uniref:Uncharacterized protein n=1 Tax=Artomyces pyxidatus TaxID=48021 RepID=A0ACB8TKP6_9AGAM|nr:hypothetical protein BV25DRAFT_1817986 [Artomyces pyxidatus]